MLSFTADLCGVHPTPFYLGDYVLANLDQTLTRIQEDPELDDFGNTLGDVQGLSTSPSVAVAHKNLYRAFGIEYLVYQNGPFAVSFHDNTGMLRGTVLGPFAGAQAVRRFLAVYHPNGIGFLHLLGYPTGVAEGLAVRICPIGESLGKNPLLNSDQPFAAFQRTDGTRDAG